jgi:hypothetical protein
MLSNMSTLSLVLGFNNNTQPDDNAVDMRIQLDMSNASGVADDTVMVHPQELSSQSSSSTWLERLAAPILRGASSSAAAASTTIAADERYYGTQRVLAVRVTSVATGEYPTETLDEMQAAIFGNTTFGSNATASSSSSSDSYVTEQFRAVSHGKLNYVPARHKQLLVPGLLEMDVTVPATLDLFDHVYWQTELVPILQQTLARILRNNATTPNNMVLATIRSVADRVLFCMPTGSLRAGTGGVAGIGGMVRTCVRIHMVPLVTLCCPGLSALSLILTPILFSTVFLLSIQ